MGEKKIFYRNIEKNDDILLIQKIKTGEKVGEKIFDILLAMHSLPKTSKVSLFLPYLYYSRQDSDAYSALDLFLYKLHIAGLKTLITFDIHSENINLYDINFINISIIDLITTLPKGHIIISPDKGGKLRAQKLANKFGMEYICLEKTRTLDSISHICKDNISLKRYKKAIIFDDIIDSGQTMFSTINYLKKHDFEEFQIIVTHNLSQQKLQFPPEVKKITIMNSITDS